MDKINEKSSSVFKKKQENWARRPGNVNTLKIESKNMKMAPFLPDPKKECLELRFPRNSHPDTFNL